MTREAYAAYAGRQAQPISDEVRILFWRQNGYAAKWRHLKFIVADEVHRGRRWRHATVSRRDRKMPTYEDLKNCKRLTIGDERMAVQIFPEAEKHMDFSESVGVEVLHLWSPEDAGVLPDFRLALTI